MKLKEYTTPLAKKRSVSAKQIHSIPQLVNSSSSCSHSEISLNLNLNMNLGPLNLAIIHITYDVFNARYIYN